MCGRYKQELPEEAVKGHFKLKTIRPTKPRYNIAPSQDVLAVRVNTDSQDREGLLLRWGLIPSWAKDIKVGYKMINARAETITTKPSFRSAFRKRRCVIVADGFYEWKKTPERGFENRKQPYLIGFKDKRVFGFAGLWESWKDHNGKTIESCTIITTGPNSIMEPIHDRMPVILPPDGYEEWLDATMDNTEVLKRHLQPYPPQEMEAYPISRLVNSPRNDSPDILLPVTVE